MAFDRQQLYIELSRRRNNAYINISTYFLFEKDNKVPSCEDADKRAATQRRSTAVARNAQRSARLRSPYVGRRRRRRPRRAALHYASCAYTFVSRRRVLSRDLGAEMLLIMRPDKPALCRVLSITRTIFHERSAQCNRYMPPRLSSSLGDVWSPFFNPLTIFFFLLEP